MILLKVKLTGKAEEQFRELLNIPGFNGKDIVLDALAIFYFASQEIKNCKSKRLAIFDLKTKVVTPATVSMLDLLTR